MADQKRRLLVVRFSSFGDIVQAMSILKWCKERLGHEQVDWLTKDSFKDLVKSSPYVDRVEAFSKDSGLLGLIKMAWQFRGRNYTHVYDAHSNLRSRVFCFILLFLNPRGVTLIRRSKERWKRFLLFRLRKNLFPRPFRGMLSYLRPLVSGDLSENFENIDLTQDLNLLEQEDIEELKNRFEILEKSYIAIAPSAAWKMKTWPITHWEDLLKLLDKYQVVVLGGPEDEFCREFERKFSYVKNLAGELNLMESSWVVKNAKALISADTGLLHVSDLVGTSGLALIGPTAFGFPTHPHLKVLEVPLECRPCTKDGRGKCIQTVYQKCMVDISAQRVFDELKMII